MCDSGLETAATWKKRKYKTIFTSVFDWLQELMIIVKDRHYLRVIDLGVKQMH